MIDLIKVPAMIRKLFIVLTLAVFAPALLAQSNELGVLIGSIEPVNDELGVDTDMDVREIYFAKMIESGTWLKLKAGEADLSGESLDEGLAPESETDLRYVQLLVGYEFDEIFGTTYLFAGPGAYELERNGENSESEFGFVLGVGADFPLTRQLGIVAELTYHWVDFEAELRTLNLGIGGRFRF